MKQVKGREVVFVTLCLIAGLSLSVQAGVKPLVFVSIAPQATFVERIGGDRVRVEALVQPGHSPATYEPSPRQMAALASAALYLRVGVAFENSFLPKIRHTLPSLPVVDTRRGITLRVMKTHHHHEDTTVKNHEGPGDPQPGNDPHIWLSPRLVMIQARTIAEALTTLDPAGTEWYRSRCDRFILELKALDARLAVALAPVRGRTLMVFHPAWGYFAEAYGLHQEPIEVEGKTPSARQLARIIDEAKREQVRVIFVQSQFSRASARAIAKSIGGAVIPINPLAGDYCANLESIATAVATALTGQK